MIKQDSFDFRIASCSSGEMSLLLITCMDASESTTKTLSSRLILVWEMAPVTVAVFEARILIFLVVQRIICTYVRAVPSLLIVPVLHNVASTVNARPRE